MAIQQVFVANSAKEPVHAHLEGTARAELTESAGRRWAIRIDQPANSGPEGYVVLRFSRPAVLDMIAGPMLPGAGTLVVMSPELDANTGSAISCVSINFSSTSFYLGTWLKLPYRDSMLPPTLLSVPVLADGDGHMDLRVAIQPAPPANPIFGGFLISLAGHFTD